MKSRKVFALMMALGMVSLMVAGCGKTAENTAPEDVEITEEAVEEAPVLEPVEAAEPEEPEEPAEPEEVSWFDEQGLTITPQGDIKYVTGSGEAGEPQVEIEPGCSMSISETTEDCPDGYKKVICSVKSDFSEYEDMTFWFWVSAFDRYTGTSFESDNTELNLNNGETGKVVGAVTIQNGDKAFDVQMEISAGNDFPIWTDQFIITCPADYDGTIFQLGYFDADLAAANENIDYGSKQYTIDQLPAYDTNGHKYYYFSYTDD